MAALSGSLLRGAWTFLLLSAVATGNREVVSSHRLAASEADAQRHAHACDLGAGSDDGCTVRGGQDSDGPDFVRGIEAEREGDVEEEADDPPWRCCCMKPNDKQGLFAVLVERRLAVGATGMRLFTSHCPRLSSNGVSADAAAVDLKKAAQEDTMCACTKAFLRWINPAKCKPGSKLHLKSNSVDRVKTEEDKATCSKLCSKENKKNLPRIAEKCAREEP